MLSRLATPDLLAIPGSASRGCIIENCIDSPAAHFLCCGQWASDLIVEGQSYMRQNHSEYDNLSISMCDAWMFISNRMKSSGMLCLHRTQYYWTNNVGLTSKVLVQKNPFTPVSADVFHPEMPDSEVSRLGDCLRRFCTGKNSSSGCIRLISAKDCQTHSSHLSGSITY